MYASAVDKEQHQVHCHCYLWRARISTLILIKCMRRIRKIRGCFATRGNQSGHRQSNLSFMPRVMQQMHKMLQIPRKITLTCTAVTCASCEFFRRSLLHKLSRELNLGITTPCLPAQISLKYSFACLVMDAANEVDTPYFCVTPYSSL